ncbi:MAG TPA: vWA domain-containing protein [Phycisphaerales bacterium]|nr:vWA domain-containing protein [Phycisphaerales bacterium]
MRTRRAAALTVTALAAAAGPAQTGATGQQPPSMLGNSAMHRLHAEPAVEVVFVLDTTGSMSGLIEGAKAKIWSIANQIASAKPRPIIRMGLVGYRDRGDDYVTTITSLTDDLDRVYSDLMGYSANGGGDGPESVNEALHRAVTGCDWTPRDDDSPAPTLRLIYLVGDAPPHMDYEQDVKYHASCEEAAKRGIIVNAIQCGSEGETTKVWQEIARLAEGEYFAIEQSGGMVAVATPFDAELAELSTRLSDTLIGYGSPEEQRAVEDRRDRARGLAAEAPAPAAAERAAYVAKDESGATLAGRQELVQDLAAGRVRLDELEEDELPAELRDLPAAEREGHVRAKAAERAAHQARIAELAAKRQQFIRDEMSRLGGGGGDSFDQRVLESLRAQAARIGITYD